ncbi:MAG: serine--tRNA ligase [Bacteroidales bacterium]|nr:serine--tRNA ligase [Bacteroidales bacterium]
MLLLDVIRENPSVVKKKLAIKNFKNLEIIDEIIDLDKQRRSLQLQRDQQQKELNDLSKKIGHAYQSKNIDQAEKLKQISSSIKEQISQIEKQHDEVANLLHEKLLLLPNLPSDQVKPGQSAEDNEIVFEYGHPPHLPFDALPHWDLAKKFNLIDFELGAKITGSGFPVYTGIGALYQRALIHFFLNECIAAGYYEIQPPLLVNESSAFGTGQLPDKDKQMYFVPEDNLYLIPTAEVPVTNLYRDMIIGENELPIKMVAYSVCFRREAGSYGKDVRGLNRLHQFDKVEIVQITHPDKSYDALNEMVDHVKNILIKLNLPFRIVRLCGGDMSFASALTYDFEVYSAAQQKWLEVSSVSNFETFQAVRMKLKFKGSDGKTHYPHTLNGSSLALPRLLAALLENNQTNEGLIIPEPLRDIMQLNIIKS